MISLNQSLKTNGATVSHQKNAEKSNENNLNVVFDELNPDNGIF